MYAHIKGNVEEIYADRVVIEAAGVGYELVCSKMTLKRLCEGKTAKLFVHFHLSQDSVRCTVFLMQRNGQCSESS